MKLGDAIVYLLGDKSQLDDTLDKGEKDTRSWASRIGDTLQGAVSFAMGGAITAGIGAVAGAISSGASAVLDFASQARQNVNDLQSSLGITRGEAQALGDTSRAVFANNFGGSLEGVNNAIITVRQNIQGLANEDLQAATENAYRLNDVFGIEIPASTAAVNTLMGNFGLTQQQAFDFITSGVQNGLNASGDFLETITEYSTQFSNGGASAGEFFSVMQTGLGNGMLGTDKAADAFKEFNVRILDGSKTTAAGLAQLGLNANDITTKIADGSMTQMQAFDLVIGKLREAPDAATQYQAGVALLGGQFEDLGVDAVLAIDSTKTALGDMAGATDSLNVKYDNFGSLWEGFKRQALNALEPIGGGLLNLANTAMPAVQQGLATLSSGIESLVSVGSLLFTGEYTGSIFGLSEDDPAIDTLYSIRDAGLAAIDWFSSTGVPMFQDAWATVGTAIGDVVGWLQGALPTAISFVMEHWNELQGALISVAALLGGAALVGGIASLVGTLALIANPVGLIIAAVGLLGAAWAGNWGDIQGKTQAAWDVIRPPLEQLTNWLSVAIPAAVQATADFWTGTLQPALATAGNFITGTLIPTLSGLASGAMVQVQNAADALANFWTGTLQPAFAAVGNFLNSTIFPIFGALANVWLAIVKKEVEVLAALWQNVLMPAFSAVAGFVTGTVIPALTTLAQNVLADVRTKAQQVADFWNSTLKPAFDAIASIIKTTTAPAVEKLTELLGGLKTWLGYIGSSVGDVVGWLNTLADKIGGIKIPEWLQGHSPPPLADWFSYIADGIQSVTSSLPNMASAMTDAARASGEAIGSVLDDLNRLKAQAQEVILGILDSQADLSRGRYSTLDQLNAVFKPSDDALKAQQEMNKLLQKRDELTAKIAKKQAAIDAEDDPAKRAKLLAERRELEDERSKTLESYNAAFRERIGAENVDQRIANLRKSVETQISGLDADADKRGLTDEEKVSFIGMRTKQLLEMAKLQRELIEGGDNTNVSARINALMAAQTAERTAFDARQSATPTAAERLGSDIAAYNADLAVRIAEEMAKKGDQHDKALIAVLGQLATLIQQGGLGGVTVNTTSADVGGVLQSAAAWRASQSRNT